MTQSHIQKPRIRVIALGLVQQQRRLLLHQGFDSIKQQTFYRALGGGVEFGESSAEALQREFHEEIQAELTNIQYLGCIPAASKQRGPKGLVSQQI